MNIKSFIYKLALPLARIYWRIARPQTVGVKVLVFHPQDTNQIILVRHSYGNRHLWNLPGGGYNARKEDPLAAAVREVREELGLNMQSCSVFGTYKTESEGKRDTVSLVDGSCGEPIHLKVGAEIAEAVWENWRVAAERSDLARVARIAIQDRLAKV